VTAPVLADDEWVEQLAHGEPPQPNDRLAELFAALRDECRKGT
jgi:hypothetical protein